MMSFSFCNEGARAVTVLVLIYVCFPIWFIRMQISRGHNAVVATVMTIFLVIFSIILTVTFLKICCKINFSIEVNQDRIVIYYRAEDCDDIERGNLLNEQQVLELAEIKYTTTNSPDDEENPCDGAEHRRFNSSCSICIEDFEENESVRVLPCGHLYHTDCIMPWLTTRCSNCPICKVSLVKDEKDNPKNI
jgi:hypothetical protein